MDLHPIIVHFPVALLSTYAVMELITFGKLKGNRTFFSIKATFLLLGTLGSYAAFIAGTFAEDKYGPGAVRDIIEMHRTFAISVLVIFSVLALGYVIDLVLLWGAEHDAGKGSWSVFKTYNRFILSTIPLKALAILGLAAITVTGALGGTIVHGPGADPLAGLIYRMLL